MRATLQKFLTLSTNLKRWILLLGIGFFVAVSGISLGLSYFLLTSPIDVPEILTNWTVIIVGVLIGVLLMLFSGYRLMRNIIAPYQERQEREFIDIVREYNQRDKGMKFVAIGGGTGLPASLRGMRQYTQNITAIVTVADDGGSSGRLRRDMGVPPPGDLRNNIVALADEDSLLTKLFQYRFTAGDLEGHSFGNLFIASLAAIVQEDETFEGNSLAEALVQVERILNVKGEVLPATLADVHLAAEMLLPDSSRIIKVRGESQIGHFNGSVDTVEIEPADAEAYEPSVQAILNADVIVLGPGSLYTSIIPNLMVRGIADALRATDAYKIYVCNVATQPTETTGYTVADHVLALEKHIGRGVFQAVLANNVYPNINKGVTQYVDPVPEHHEVLERYEVRYTNLTDSERPWRHDTHRLADAILKLVNGNTDLLAS